MEEEVSKHTKKIYRAISNPKQSPAEKAKEVGMEIFIITFAVTLSIWLHSWSDQRHEQKEAGVFLKGLKEDLVKDIAMLEENKKAMLDVDTGWHFVMALNDGKAIDTVSEHLIPKHLDISLVASHPNIGRYEGFKSSGKIDNIDNDSLKQKILVYYQQTMPGLNDVEGIVNTLQMRVMDMQVDKDDKTSFRSIAKTFKMRALLSLGTQNIDAEIQAYEEAEGEAKKIIRLIDQMPR